MIVHLQLFSEKRVRLLVLGPAAAHLLSRIYTFLTFDTH